jgi:mono/diheme cytochrome c family protein
VNVRRLLAGLSALGVSVGALALAYAWRGEIPPAAPPPAASFDSALVRRGQELALLGDCATCHTAPKGVELAGNLAMPTPFGVIYSTNITPDPETGIGRWSEAAFARAMHEGVGRRGEHLYPAFPFDHFTLTSNDDVKALYAYLMTRPPVRSVAHANELPFPINIRLVLQGWKLLFFRDKRFQPDPARDAVWNRGKYLVQGLGHCGGCHSPRNLMGAEIRNAAFQGGTAEGWQAFALAGASRSRIPWTESALTAYLRKGWQVAHGAALGPMRPVTQNLAEASEADVAAIARYLSSLSSPAVQPVGKPTSPAPAWPEPRMIATAGLQAPTPDLVDVASRGRQLYDMSCASCHESGRTQPLGGLPLAFSSAVVGESPSNLVNLIIGGIPARPGLVAPIMPGFGATMTNQDIAALAQDLRARLGGRPDWSDLSTAIVDARRLHAPLQQTAAMKETWP